MRSSSSGAGVRGRTGGEGTSASFLALGSTRGGAHSFPSLFMSVVVVQQSGNPALLVVLHGEPRPDAAQGIEKRVWRVRLHLGYLSVGILLVERLALTEQSSGQVPVGIAILAGNSVEHCRSQLDRGWMKRHHQPFGVGRRWRRG